MIRPLNQWISFVCPFPTNWTQNKGQNAKPWQQTQNKALNLWPSFLLRCSLHASTHTEGLDSTGEQTHVNWWKFVSSLDVDCWFIEYRCLKFLLPEIHGNILGGEASTVCGLIWGDLSFHTEESLSIYCSNAVVPCDHCQSFIIRGCRWVVVTREPCSWYLNNGFWALSSCPFEHLKKMKGIFGFFSSLVIDMLAMVLHTFRPFDHFSTTFFFTAF